MIPVSAYIPCFNNAKTIRDSVKSILNQSYPIDQFFVIDDGSRDDSVSIVKSMGIEVIEGGINRGRGWARNHAMQLSKHEFVLCCDAGKSIETNFLENAMPWFENLKIASIYGSLRQKNPRTAAERWRGIYLYKERDLVGDMVNMESPLITYATLVRRSYVMEVGNYNTSYTHTEDKDLGLRLNEKGYITMSDGNLISYTLESCDVLNILNRYWRWYTGENETISCRNYIKNINYSIKVMVKQDLQDMDLKRAIISLLCPHFQFWHTVYRKLIND